MFMLLIALTPTAAFLALTVPERHALLQQFAAPIQEWTGQDGGVIFSERVPLENGTWIVILAVTVRSETVVAAFRKALEAAVTGGYVSFHIVAGPILARIDKDDADEEK